MYKVADHSLIKDNIGLQVAAFMGVSKDATRSVEDQLSTPLPGETLAVFYARSSTFSLIS